jgi:hypothetical protein
MANVLQVSVLGSSSGAVGFNAHHLLAQCFVVKEDVDDVIGRFAHFSAVCPRDKHIVFLDFLFG